LGDDLPIERITVMPWQFEESICVFGSVGQNADVQILNRLTGSGG